MASLVSNPKYQFLKELGISEENSGVFSGQWNANGKVVESINPATNEVIAKVRFGTQEDYEKAITATREAYLHWRNVPAPARGEIVRQIGDRLRQNLDNLGKLVSIQKFFATLINIGLGFFGNG